jgi:hypothetical protein
MQSLSVTRVLSPFTDFSSVPPDRLQFAADRGRAVHAACAAYARGLPVLIDNGAYDFFACFRDWYDKHVARALFIESEFSDPHTYGIIGHPDIVCELADGRVVVVDYKTPAVESPTWKAQLAAYCYLVRPVVGDADGLALMLSRDGKPARAVTYQRQAQDFAAFVAALTAWRYFKGGMK